MTNTNESEPEPKEYDGKKDGNPYMRCLNQSIGKECTVVDNLGREHRGTVIGFNMIHLNLVIKSEESKRIRFIRNITWFEYDEE